MPETAAVAPDWTGRPCPKCAYVRTAQDANPAWQCPRCQVAYAKFDPAAVAARASFAAHGRAIGQRASGDHSFFLLIGINLLALGIAVALHMNLRGLMLVYWAQSVAIGITHFIRILSLERFDPGGARMNDRPIEETPADKTAIALFFAAHYGIFHVVYLMFLLPDHVHPLQGSIVAYLLLPVLFLGFHLFSLQRNIESDRQGRPNIGTLMFLPYARILPMHLTILSGFAFRKEAVWGLLLFGVLKTAADAAMHLLNHHLMGKPPAPIESPDAKPSGG